MEKVADGVECESRESAVKASQPVVPAHFDFRASYFAKAPTVG
jgi:hypothetical protein